VRLNERFDRCRQLVNAPQNLRRDILRNIVRPMLSGVECGHADRVAVLARHQIGDDGFEVGPLDVGLGKSGARCPKLLTAR
jgi:hypothetical protein